MAMCSLFGENNHKKMVGKGKAFAFTSFYLSIIFIIVVAAVLLSRFNSIFDKFVAFRVHCGILQNSQPQTKQQPRT